ncbi:MAG: AraC family transcriptional regulator [Nevskiaceae bacterium]|nr:MAG: AraC family transcriptional regulator [Nevskiaceae bacterium]TBR71405.1 MAG: AraC family transcriptional regulator [Nevskiaceae bacterium]
MMKSGLSGWMLAMARTLEDEGINYKDIFNSVGMDPAFLGDSSNRYWQRSMSNLWAAAVAATHDPYFGLRMAAHIRPSTFHVLGYAMSCSSTLGAALQRFTRYAKLVSDSATISLTKEPEVWHLSFNLNTGVPLLPQNIDAVLAGLVAFNRWITGEDTAPEKVQFRHALVGDRGEYEKLFRCPVAFDCEEDSLTFHASDMDRPVLSANEPLAVFLDDMTVQHLANLSGRFSRDVRECLLKQFHFGDTTKSRTAKLMHMTERTLSRRLRDEGTTFRDVLDKLREELAYEYMRDSDATIEHISSQLGFSDASTFSRAFQRWTGRRPSNVRRNLTEHKAQDEESASSTTP